VVKNGVIIHRKLFLTYRIVLEDSSGTKSRGLGLEEVWLGLENVGPESIPVCG